VLHLGEARCGSPCRPDALSGSVASLAPTAPLARPGRLSAGNRTVQRLTSSKGKPPNLMSF